MEKENFLRLKSFTAVFMTETKTQRQSNYPLAAPLLVSLLVVATITGLLRFVGSVTRPAVASEPSFDLHYVSRSLEAGSLGHYGPSTKTVLIEGVRAVAPQTKIFGQKPALLRLAPARATTVTLQIQNRSQATWQTKGANGVTLRLAKNSSGALRHRWWKGDVVGKLAKPVPAGEVGTFRFAVKGPAATGYAQDTFTVYRGGQKLSGSDYTLGALVGDTEERLLRATVPGDVTLTMDPGAEQRVYVAAVNAGRQAWQNDGFGKVRLLPTIIPSAFQASTWLSASTVNRLPHTTIAPGKTALVPLWLKTPTVPGTYSEIFTLVSTDIGPIEGGTLRVTITVPDPTPPLLFTPQEPVVRIGLFSQTTNPTVTLKATGDAKLTTTDGAVIVPIVTAVTITKEGALYRYTADALTGTTTLPLRVEAPPTTIVEIASWERRPSWNPALNDNLYRGTVEFRTATNGKTWVINELPIESYLRGLAETSGTDALEFRKALLTAARSYALHHWSKKTKHGDENYDLNATTDQVYRGYAHELRSPSVAQGVEATRGMVMFHAAAQTSINPNGIILAAYSACTDGRTRAFQEVFGGDGSMTPYLVSVPDPDGICQTERYRLGLDGNHMVGLSGNGARAAALAGATYDQILLQYYTSVTLAKFYD